MKQLFHNVFEGKNVLITGDSGFKGSWLALWLKELGADVTGFSLDPPTSPNHFSLCHLDHIISHIHGDICDYAFVQKTIETVKPDIIFHLAAQSLVLPSYENPKYTFDVNVGGTVNLFEAVRLSDTPPQAIVMITTDKVYDNQEWFWGYRETDKLGGRDPYSASKSMAELAVTSYRASFFNKETSPTMLASARAGNVIGGGDFADFRLVPDAMRALMAELPIEIRNPNSIRPWMHVLDPLSGYLCLAKELLLGHDSFADAWNFGPKEHKGISCKKMADKMVQLWQDGGKDKSKWVDRSDKKEKKEMHHLRLNWEKAAHALHWHPVYGWEEALEETVTWFKAFQQIEKTQHIPDMQKVSLDHINRYIERAKTLNLDWTTA